MKKKTYSIAVSGAAETEHCCKEINKLAKELGKEIARQKCVLITGATTGVPYLAAKAANTSISYFDSTEEPLEASAIGTVAPPMKLTP